MENLSRHCYVNGNRKFYFLKRLFQNHILQWRRLGSAWDACYREGLEGQDCRLPASWKVKLSSHLTFLSEWLSTPLGTREV